LGITRGVEGRAAAGLPRPALNGAPWDFLPQLQPCAALAATLCMAFGNRMGKRGVSWRAVKKLTENQENRQSINKKYNGLQ
jgi:hypothetical protein